MGDLHFFNRDKNSYEQLRILILELIDVLQPKTEKDQRFYDSADLKHLLNVGDKTLYRMRKQGKIPYFKLGKKYFYPRSFFKKKAL